MIKPIVKWLVRRTNAQLSRGEYADIVKQFHPDARLVMLGSTPLSAEVRGTDNVRRWIERAYTMFPDLAFVPQIIVVDGPPWRMRVATQYTITGTFPDGSRYENNGMQLVTLRWGRVLEEYIVEDTQRVAEALERLAEQGVEAAAERPFGDEPVTTAASGGR